MIFNELCSDNPDLKKLSELSSLLRTYRYYCECVQKISVFEKEAKKAGKGFNKFPSNRRMKKYLRAAFNRDKIKSYCESPDIKVIQARLGEFKNFLDTKYWEEDIITCLEASLLSGVAANIPEAVEYYLQTEK